MALSDIGKLIFCTEVRLQAQFGLVAWETLVKMERDDCWMWHSYQSAMDVVTAAARIARIFEPAPRKKAPHFEQAKARGEELRAIFPSWNKMKILGSKDVRNSIEHFDERIDEFLIETPGEQKVFVDMIPPGMFRNVKVDGEDKSGGRHIDPDTWTFRVFGDEVPLLELAGELRLLQAEAQRVGKLW